MLERFEFSIYEYIQTKADQFPIDETDEMVVHAAENTRRQKQPLVCRDGRWIDPDGRLHDAHEEPPVGMYPPITEERSVAA